MKEAAEKAREAAVSEGDECGEMTCSELLEALELSRCLLLMRSNYNLNVSVSNVDEVLLCSMKCLCFCSPSSVSFYSTIYCSGNMSVFFLSLFIQYNIFRSSISFEQALL